MKYTKKNRVDIPIKKQKTRKYKQISFLNLLMLKYKQRGIYQSCPIYKKQNETPHIIEINNEIKYNMEDIEKEIINMKIDYLRIRYEIKESTDENKKIELSLKKDELLKKINQYLS